MLDWFDTRLATASGTFGWAGPHSHRGWLGFARHEGPDAVVYTLSVPGYRKQDIEIEVRDRRVIVRGERSEGFLKHTAYRSFAQSFTLPAALDSDGVEADLHGGVLSLTIAKKPE